MPSRPSELLPFDEVSDRLRLTSRSYVGIVTIPLELIIGSVDRVCEFDRDFRPRRRDSQARLQKLRTAFPEGGFPAISAFEIGGVYFVSDGHHRVALAHEQGRSFIDAEVVRMQTNHRLRPDVDIPELIHTELQRILMEESGLDQVRPDLRLTFSNPAGYVELLESIKSYGWDLAVRLGRLPDRVELAEDWLSAIYDPGIDAIRQARPDLERSELTRGDLFLWLYQRRRTVCASGGACGYSQTVREALDRHRKLPKELRRALRRQAAAMV